MAAKAGFTVLIFVMYVHVNVENIPLASFGQASSVHKNFIPEAWVWHNMMRIFCFRQQMEVYFHKISHLH